MRVRQRQVAHLELLLVKSWQDYQVILWVIRLDKRHGGSLCVCL